MPQALAMHPNYRSGRRISAIVLLGFLMSFAGAGCGKHTAAIAAHRLGKSELESWLNQEFKSGKAVSFQSNEGMGLCCDMGSVTLMIRPDREIEISINLFAGLQFALPYSIGADGRIALASSSAYPVPALSNNGIHDLYAYRYGSAVYLVKDTTVNPDLGKPTQTIWPLKFVPAGR
jgi:hypothetical protein